MKTVDRPARGASIGASVAGRLRAIRMEIFGDAGGPELAGRLGLPPRTWINYEGGVTIPGDVLLRFLVVTCAEPLWLLRGEGAKFRAMTAEAAADP